MNWTNHIAIDPEVLAGKPVIKATRLSVTLVIGHLARGWSIEDLLSSYPRLTEENVRACLAYAAEILERNHTAPSIPDPAQMGKPGQ